MMNEMLFKVMPTCTHLRVHCSTYSTFSYGPLVHEGIVVKNPATCVGGGVV